MIANNTTRLLSSIYSTLTDAQTAYPLCNLNGYMTSLSDELDWAALQEAVLRAENTLNLPHVSGGIGIARINRTLRLSGSNKGIVLSGPITTSAHQGSTPAGLTIRYGNSQLTEIVTSTVIDTALNTITVGSNTDKFITGRWITFNSTGTLPAPLAGC